MLNVAPDCIWEYLNIQKFLKGEGAPLPLDPSPRADDQVLQLAPSKQKSWLRQCWVWCLAWDKLYKLNETGGEDSYLYFKMKQWVLIGEHNHFLV